jgi:hypothetical protein
MPEAAVLFPLDRNFDHASPISELISKPSSLPSRQNEVLSGADML